MVAALPVACATIACATIMPGRGAALQGPPAASVEGVRAMVALARMADAVDVPFPDRVKDQLVRWQLDLRDRLHDLAGGVTALAARAEMMLPDLTVLSIEPVANTESSGFGWRDDPIRHTRSFHSGTDFRGKPGTPVAAAGDGVVTFCGRLGGYGNVVDIDHGGGVVTRYAHLRRIETRRAAAVIAGEIIGRVGSTGRATGPHLHFEVRIDGSPVSPVAAMTIAALQREFPLVGQLAALSLSPVLQASAESDIDPPKQRAKQRARPSHRPERPGRAKRPQVLW